MSRMTWLAGNPPKVKLTRFAARDGLLQLNEYAVTALREDASGHLWIGFEGGGGLARYRAGRFEPFQPGQEAFKGAIRTIFLDHAGRLWVASTQAGLSRIDNPTSARPRLTGYTTEEGLSSNQSSSVRRTVVTELHIQLRSPCCPFFARWS